MTLPIPSYPKLRNADGSPRLCGAQIENRSDKPCSRCGSVPTMVCRMRATYPDQRCAEHTEWLAGTPEQRKKADHGGHRDPKASARARAWAAYFEQMSKSMPTMEKQP